MAVMQNLRLKRACAFSAIGAKLKCQGSGCTPERTP